MPPLVWRQRQGGYDRSGNIVRSTELNGVSYQWAGREVMDARRFAGLPTHLLRSGFLGAADSREGAGSGISSNIWPSSFESTVGLIGQSRVRRFLPATSSTTQHAERPVVNGQVVSLVPDDLRREMARSAAEGPRATTGDSPCDHWRQPLPAQSPRACRAPSSRRTSFSGLRSR